MVAAPGDHRSPDGRHAADLRAELGPGSVHLYGLLASHGLRPDSPAEPVTGWQCLLGALRAPGTAMRTGPNGYNSRSKLHSGPGNVTAPHRRTPGQCPRFRRVRGARLPDDLLLRHRTSLLPSSKDLRAHSRNT